MALYKKKLNIFTGKFDYIFRGNLVSFKEGVDTVGDLPSSGNSEGDARITNDNGHLHVWDGSSWQDQGDIVDLKWDSIEDKPSSSVLDIDDAVSKRHTQNTDIALRIDKLTVDVNGNTVIAGDLEVAGEYIINTTPNFESVSGITFINKTGQPAGTWAGIWIKAQGTGAGILQLYDEDNAQNLSIYCSEGVGYIDTIRSSPTDPFAGHLSLQEGSATYGMGEGVHIGEISTEGRNYGLRIYGFPTGGALKYGALKIDDVTSDFHILAENDIVLAPTGGNVKVEAELDLTSHQLANLAVPDANGEAIRQTTKITEVSLEDAVDKKHEHSNKTELDKVTIGNHDVLQNNPHNVTPTQIGVNDKYWLQTFILNTPSQVTRAFGQSANGLNPGFDIRLNSLKVQFYSEHNTQSKLRIRVYKWDGVALINREILNVTQNGVSKDYHNVEDNTPDTNYYDVDVSAGDRIWVEVDDGTGASANRVSEITVSVNYELI